MKKSLKEKLAEELKYLTDSEFRTWYAVHDSDEDQEDGFGSNDPDKAAEMAVDGDAYSVVLIYDDGSDNCYGEVILDNLKGSRNEEI